MANPSGVGALRLILRHATRTVAFGLRVCLNFYCMLLPCSDTEDFAHCKPMQATLGYGVLISGLFACDSPARHSQELKSFRRLAC
ncbi:uncharacterized protein BDV14DRAFT_98813 [Aspergillus stella-maris]|uniref:uncharacterized protein n=1 Tax=Aspergillus stella-maris TaxID=1810926 RepID=UPI003CCDEC59